MTLLLVLLIAAVSAVCQAHSVDEFEIAGYDYEDSSNTDISTDLDCRCKKRRVAFMTYLSECKDLGANQHVKFDQVTLNEGGAYNKKTGVFRVPRDGVYSFTFVVAERHKRETRVRLVIDGDIIAGAVAEGRHKYHDAMGGNTAIVDASKGQSIWVETVLESHIEGSDKYRYSTFSGHVLYYK